MKQEDYIFLGLIWEKLCNYLKNNYKVPFMLSGFLFIASMMSLLLNTNLSITMILFALFNLTLSLETREVRKHRDAYTIK